MFDPDTADLACEGHVVHWLHCADEDVRRRALDRLLTAWAEILADEVGEPVLDFFARLEVLSTALDDLEYRANVALDIPEH
jgi:hypothetical protein